MTISRLLIILRFFFNKKQIMQYKIFWCKVNKYYTDKWLNSEYLKDKQGIFVASCVVTDNAKRKWIKFIKDIFKNPTSNSSLAGGEQEHFKVFISWCWAFKNWEAQDDFFDLYPDLIKYKSRIEILWENPEEKKLEWKKEIKKLNLSKLKDKFKNTELYTKKFVLIQWGCDSFCSFCLTVVKRWRHYFRAKEDIAEDIKQFEQNWWKEIVLTWVNLTAWGLDSTNPELWKQVEKQEEVVSKFSELLEYLLENTTIKRLRISSLWPEFIDKKCLKIFENTRIYPHFHFSAQSGSNQVLKNMKRHYTWNFMKKVMLDLRNIKRQDNIKIWIWADLIVWFPGETEDDFQDTLNLIKDCKITKVHAFPFSAHKLWENVPAWFYKEQISDKIKKDRMFEIMSLSEQIRDDFIDENLWKELEVLIEVVKPDWKWKWWTQNYLEADDSNFKIISGEIKRNEIVVWKLIK